MAVQKSDKHTLPLLGVPKKRGRPVTGNALTNAQRQARHRAWKKKQREELAKSAALGFEGMTDEVVKGFIARRSDASMEWAAWVELGRRRGWLK